MKSMSSRVIGQFIAFSLVSCVADHPNEDQILVMPRKSKDTLDSNAESRYIKTLSHKIPMRRRIVTELPQSFWPTTEGNSVEILYHDSVWSDINVVMYSETGRLEFNFKSSLGQIKKGTAFDIRYENYTVGDTLPEGEIEEDTCRYRFVVSQRRGVNYHDIDIACTNGRVDCQNCNDFSKRWSDLIREVEILVTRNVR